MFLFHLFISLLVTQHREYTILRRTSQFILFADAQPRVPQGVRSSFEPETYFSIGVRANKWSTAHYKSYATPRWATPNHMSYTTPHELRHTMMSYATPRWATSHPTSYATPQWATPHHTSHATPKWATPHHDELRHTTATTLTQTIK